MSRLLTWKRPGAGRYEAPGFYISRGAMERGGPEVWRLDDAAGDEVTGHRTLAEAKAHAEERARAAGVIAWRRLGAGSYSATLPSGDAVWIRHDEKRGLALGRWVLEVEDVHRGSRVVFDAGSMSECRAAASRVAVAAPGVLPELAARGGDASWTVGPAAREGADDARGLRFYPGDLVAWRQGERVLVLEDSETLLKRRRRAVRARLDAERQRRRLEELRRELELREALAVLEHDASRLVRCEGGFFDPEHVVIINVTSARVVASQGAPVPDIAIIRGEVIDETPMDGPEAWRFAVRVDLPPKVDGPTLARIVRAACSLAASDPDAYPDPEDIDHDDAPPAASSAPVALRSGARHPRRRRSPSARAPRRDRGRRAAQHLDDLALIRTRARRPPRRPGPGGASGSHRSTDAARARHPAQAGPHRARPPRVAPRDLTTLARDRAPPRAR